MAFGVSAGTLLAGGAMVGGAYMQSKAAGDAADAQAAAANQANETQRYMYDTTRADNAPYMARGNAAGNRLQYLLGLSPTGGASSGGGNSLAGQTLVDTSTGVPRMNQGLYDSNPAYRAAWDKAYQDHMAYFGRGYDRSSDATKIDEYLRGALASSIQQDNQAATTAAASDPAYGSLLRRFTVDDLNNDPVYQSGLKFTLDEANKGVERQAAASGSLLSGATLKALQDRGIDIMNTKANESYNRFTNDQTNTFNRLAGVSGAGQQANSLVASTGANTANNISQNQIGVGNARAASAIGSANAWSNALGQGVNMYQQNQLMNKLFPGATV